MKRFVAPSILSGDFGYLAREAKRIEEAGADCIHVDIMDGHFVPNLTFGPQALAAINRASELFLDVHLMIYNPFEYVERFVEAGADRLTIHFEATEQVEETLKYIKKCGIQAGLAFCPETTEEFVGKYLSQCDLILLMTVQPGFGGQAFMPEVIEKIHYVRTLADKMGRFSVGPKDEERVPFFIEVDGGITDKTASACVEAGANVLVAGSYLFKECDDMAQGIQILRNDKD